METTKVRNPRAGALLLVLVALGALGFSLSGSPVARQAHATPVDSWSGHGEILTTVNQSYTTATAATVFTGVTNHIINIRAMVLSSSAATTLSFIDHASSKLIGQFYAAANTPYQIGEDYLGVGMQSTTQGGAIDLYVAGTSTIVITAREAQQ